MKRVVRERKEVAEEVGPVEEKRPRDWEKFRRTVWRLWTEEA